MILFDYECRNCRKTEEKLVKHADESVTCSCGTSMRKLLTTRSAKDWFTPDWYEHIAENPIFITSKRHLKEECEKHDCYSVALLNENKGTGVSQEVASNPEKGWEKSKSPRRTREIVNEQYRRVFGDV